MGAGSLWEWIFRLKYEKNTSHYQKNRKSLEKDLEMNTYFIDYVNGEIILTLENMKRQKR